MSVYNIESLRKEFTQATMSTIVTTSEKNLWDFQLVGQELFPRVGYTNDTIDNTWELTNLYPMEYRAWIGSSKVDNTPTHIVNTSLTTATKAMIRALDPERLYWLSLANTPSEQQVKNLLEDGQAIISKLTTQKEVTNEKEAWDLLTTGTLTTLESKTFQIPLYGVTTDNGILCHYRTDWITSAGLVNASADIIGDFQTAVSYMANNNFDTPTTCWMNSATFAAIQGNTKLSNTGGDQWWKPLGTYNISGDLVNWKNRKKIKLIGSMFTPMGLKVILNDSFYKSTAGVPTKFLPDNYVIFTGDTVGRRYMTPNPYDHNASTWVRNWKTNVDEIPQTIKFEVGESSLCFPDNRGNLVASGASYVTQWKSHYVMYIKDHA